MRDPLLKIMWLLVLIAALTNPAQASGPAVLSSGSEACTECSILTASSHARPSSGSDMEVRLNRVRSLMESGNVSQALAEVGALQETAYGKEGSSHRGEIFNLTGAVKLAAGSFREAEVALKKAADDARQRKDAKLLAKVLNNRAILLQQKNESRQSLAVIDEAVAIAEVAGDPDCAAKLYVTRANALLDIGDNESAERMIALAHDRHLALPPSQSRARGLTVIGDWYLQLATSAPKAKSDPLLAKARSAYADALAAAEREEDGAMSSYAAGNLGRCEELTGDYDDALRHTRAAIFHAQGSLDASRLLYLWQWQSARILRAGGLLEEAIAMNRLAVQSLQENKPSFTGADFGTAIKPVYLDLADMLLVKASTMADGPERQATLKEVLQTVKLLRSDELKDYLHAVCLPARGPVAAGQGMAGRGVALLHYLVLGERIEVLAETASGITRATVAAPLSELTGDAREFRNLIEDRNQEYLRLSRELYDLLIRPVDSVIAGASTLVIIPDGVVRTIPMAALHDGTGFLVEKHAVAMAQVDVGTGAAGLDRDRHPMLAGISGKVPGYPQIPFVDRELDGINRIFGGRVLKNRSFTASSLSEGMKESAYDMIHVASHGVFADDIAESYLVTWDGKLQMDQLGSIAGRRKYSNTPLELLVLSACSTAAGDERASLGLAGVAVRAGAENAIASLWEVDDEATADFFASFYRILKEHPAQSKAQALRQAQLQMLHTSPARAGTLAGQVSRQGQSPSYTPPFYWAPFVLVTGSI